MRTRLTALIAALGVVLMSTGLVMFTAPAASAHHNTITPQAECQPDGTWRVTWKIENSETDKTEKLSAASRLSTQINGELVDPAGSLTVSETVPNNAGTLTLQVTGTWDNNKSGVYGDTVEGVADVVNTSSGKISVGGSCAQKPADKVETVPETQKSCEGGVQERTRTTTKEYVWDAGTKSWVLEPAEDFAVTWSPWVKVRDLTPAERTQLNCQPDKIVVQEKESRQSCEAGIEERTSTTVKEYVRSGNTWVVEPSSQWEVTYTPWTKVRDLTKAEKKQLGCYGSQPPNKVDTVTTYDVDCTGKYDRKVTTTKEYVLTEDGWVLEPEADWSVVDTGWVKVRDLTGEEKKELGCYGDGPGAEVVSQSEERSSCAAGVERRTVTTTKEYVLTDAGWVVEPEADWTVVDSGWVKVRDLTPEEALALGCVKGVEEIVPTVSFTDPTCDSPKAADWAGTFTDVVDYRVDGKVAPGSTVVVTAELKSDAAGQVAFPAGTDLSFEHAYPSLEELDCVLGTESSNPKPTKQTKPVVRGTAAAVPTAVAAGVAGGGSAGSGGLLAQSLVGAGLALLMVAGWLTWSGRGLRGTREA